MKSLAPRQREVLLKIAFYLESGIPPSAAQLAEDLGLAGESSVTPVLKALEKKGYLLIGAGVRGRQRSLQLTPRAQAELKQPGIPLLGTIPAGPLKEALEQPEQWVDDLREVLPYRQGDFLLRVVGDSMIGDGILSGDLVLLRPGLTPAAGEISAVAIGDEYQVTLKHVWFEAASACVRLVASNPLYPDQRHPADSVQIAGVFRGLLRPN
jgi:repressor LexA